MVILNNVVHLREYYIFANKLKSEEWIIGL